MKIVFLRSSPHKNGSSNLLADSFKQGVLQNGHEVIEFDIGLQYLKPCFGCDHCGMDGDCIHHDGMTEIKKTILSSDMVVFVTPLYYYGFSAQLKLVIDRFYSFNSRLMNKHLKSALLVASWDNENDTMDEIVKHYQKLCEYLHFNDQGMILGLGCGTPQMTKSSKYIYEAQEFGKRI